MPYSPKYTTKKLLELLSIPSPTGFADTAIDWMASEVSDLGFKPRFTRKGALLWTLEPHRRSRKTSNLPVRALAAHVDTLGAMVRELRRDGRVRLTQIGSYDWATVEGEYCTLHTSSGQKISGTVVSTKQSLHVFGPELHNLKRDASNLELRLDVLIDGQEISNNEDLMRLGVQVGDYVSWDARNQRLASGHIKSRHLDNKAACAILLGISKAVLEDKLEVSSPTHCFISNFEEVGHGAAAGIPAEVSELIAIDMAAVGRGQNSSEHHCTLCLKDSSGPYDHRLSQQLRALAVQAQVDLRTDTYPYYSSDGSAALRAGLEARVALIGPGVDASHAYERTHEDALNATAKLLLEYITH